MSKSRRERFKKLSKKRLQNAVFTINSIGKLAVRSNYDYKDQEVWDIVSALVWEVKDLLLKFSINVPVEERLNRLLRLDREQLAAIKISDPELYELIIGKNVDLKKSLESFNNQPFKEPKFLKTNAQMRFKKLKETQAQLLKSEKVVEKEINRLKKIMDKK